MQTLAVDQTREHLAGSHLENKGNSFLPAGALLTRANRRRKASARQRRAQNAKLQHCGACGANILRTSTSISACCG